MIWRPGRWDRKTNPVDGSIVDSPNNLLYVDRFFGSFLWEGYTFTNQPNQFTIKTNTFFCHDSPTKKSLKPTNLNFFVVILWEMDSNEKMFTTSKSYQKHSMSHQKDMRFVSWPWLNIRKPVDVSWKLKNGFLSWKWRIIIYPVWTRCFLATPKVWTFWFSLVATLLRTFLTERSDGLPHENQSAKNVHLS